jgi:type 1 glutamine amidotransferase
MKRLLLPALVLGLLVLPGAARRAPEKKPAEKKPAEKKPHVVFVTGDCEYRSEITMPMLAKILEAKHGMKCTVCYSRDDKGKLAPKYRKNIKGLEALKTADLAVIFIRFRELPEDQLKRILDYVKSGKPLVGLRTSTHAFAYGKAPNSKWNDAFGREVFGQKWITHHGHDSSTRVTVKKKEHPICRGVAPSFHCRSWLYQVTPLHPDCVELLQGEAIKGEKADGKTFGKINPVAWTKVTRKQRVFFTTLGHPKDFEVESVRRLLINGIYWALGNAKKIPERGCNAEIQGKYTAPATTRAIPHPYPGERVTVRTDY